MQGNLKQLKIALQPLGEFKTHYKQLKYNCPHCEKSGAPVDKYNLEVRFDNTKSTYHCWACGDKGTLKQLVEKYGIKDYSYLFKNKNEYEPEEEVIKLFELPDNLIDAYKDKKAKDYLLSRGITIELIKQRGIKYCISGSLQDCIIFPSYEEDNLTSYVSHNLKTKKYRNHRSKDYRGCYLNYINKLFPIIIVEGIYDALVLPNSIPLLGLSINDKLLYFLGNCEVYLFLDNTVDEVLYNNLLKKLKSTVGFIKIIESEKYKDSNEFYCENQKELTSLLQTYYNETAQ